MSIRANPETNEIEVLAITELGRPINHTEDEVGEAIKLLALNGGKSERTSEMLKEQGIDILPSKLNAWKQRSFKVLYQRTRRELSRDIGEDIAGRAFERALEYDEAEQSYIQEAEAKLPLVPAGQLAKAAEALARAKSHNIEKAQLLRHEPTIIVDIDVREAIETLERLGVVEKAIDAEVVEEEDA